MLKRVGIVKSATKAYSVFSRVISADFSAIPVMSSSEYVNYCWNEYISNCPAQTRSNSLNGGIFELILVSELYRQSLSPLFLQAMVAFVPNVSFDVLLYSSDQFPIGLSLKTSLRERYKQADLEAVALKYVHRRALNYLITLDSAEAYALKERAKNGDLLGIDEVVDARTADIDTLVSNLKSMEFICPEKIEVIQASRKVTRL